MYWQYYFGRMTKERKKADFPQGPQRSHDRRNHSDWALGESFSGIPTGRETFLPIGPCRGPTRRIVPFFFFFHLFPGVNPRAERSGDVEIARGWLSSPARLCRARPPPLKASKTRGGHRLSISSHLYRLAGLWKPMCRRCGASVSLVMCPYESKVYGVVCCQSHNN